LSNPAVDGAIVGFRRPDQIEPLLPAGAIELSADDLATIAGDQ
jgi:aryl-alcohol dehydrogenase-like predicted oxidoreductase